MYEDCAYLQAEVRDVSTIDVECNQVDVVIRVSEGEVNLVGEVIIEGNLETKDNVIRREIELYTGLPLSRERFERSQRGIARLDYWEQVPGGMDGRLRRDQRTSATNRGGKPTSRSATPSART